MNNTTKKIIALVLALGILALSGCGAKSTENPSQNGGGNSTPSSSQGENSGSSEQGGQQEPENNNQNQKEPEDTGYYIEVMREGEKSKIAVDLVSGVVADYTVAVCPEYFKCYNYQTVDMYLYENWGGESNVYYAISAYEGEYDFIDFEAGIRLQYEESYEEITFEQTKIAGYNATAAYLRQDIFFPGYNTHIYAVFTDGICLLIEVRVVTEMYEGLYPIIMASLNELKIK